MKVPQIEYNPLRVLGVFANATLREIEQNKAQLRAYARVSLEPHEKKTVEFTLDTRNFGYYNWKNEFVIEARPQEIFLCSDSSTILERTEISFTGEDKEILHDRVYNFGVKVI